MDLLNTLAGANFPVFIRKDLAPALVLPQGKGGCRAVICSIPKSGTYLYGELMKALGLVDCGVHLREDGFTDYRFASLEQSRTQHRSLHAECALKDSVALMHPGQFTVGHLACNEYTISALQDLKIIFTYRNLRDAMVSQMRFFAKNKRGTSVTEGWGELPDSPDKMKKYIQFHGDFFMETRCATMVGWLDHPNVLKCSFETIYGDNGAEARAEMLQAIERHLELPEPVPAEGLFEKLLGTETITSSGKRTERSVYWDDEVESYFQSKGGVDMNRRLGFEE